MESTRNCHGFGGKKSQRSLFKNAIRLPAKPKKASNKAIDSSKHVCPHPPLFPLSPGGVRRAPPPGRPPPPRLRRFSAQRQDSAGAAPRRAVTPLLRLTSSGASAACDEEKLRTRAACSLLAVGQKEGNPNMDPGKWNQRLKPASPGELILTHTLLCFPSAPAKKQEPFLILPVASNGHSAKGLTFPGHVALWTSLEGLHKGQLQWRFLVNTVDGQNPFRTT